MTEADITQHMNGLSDLLRLAFSCVRVHLLIVGELAWTYKCEKSRGGNRGATLKVGEDIDETN